MTTAPPESSSQIEGEPAVDLQLNSVSQILSALDEAPFDQYAPQVPLQNQLAFVRLGVASSLFRALRFRHPPTAGHSLRVALGCSSWCLASELEQRQRDQIEVAALLHDIGKVGTSDEILKQPTPLTPEQVALMDQSRRYGIEILSTCCRSAELIKTVAYVGAWLDGSRGMYHLTGDAIPIGARMIAIVDAFDAMTTDRVYRKAMPRECAIAELFENAGTQFDPNLVRKFASLQTAGRLTLNQQVARRWLQSLSEHGTAGLWQLRDSNGETTNEIIIPPAIAQVFHERLFDSIQVGVFFLDPTGVILRWNHAAERITGITASSVVQQKWEPAILKMKEGTGRIIRHQNCPIERALASGHKSRRHIMIKRHEGDFRQIDLQVIPIVSWDGIELGVAALMRDATSEAYLEQRVETLHKKAICDPLTGLANRAEFDRFHKESIQRHNDRKSSCSLIICDIDRFKSINDQFGHQAGDEALVRFAGLLQRSCRQGDLVARYGGEEFVMVCEDCSSAEATRLAEAIRQDLAQTPIRELSGESISASFGVTELQPGDTPETMLRRADRGLLQAKDTGRNRVIQLGSGMDSPVAAPRSRSGWWSWARSTTDQTLFACHLSTNVPLPLVAEKLRGFVADHKAEIVSITEEQVVIHVSTASFFKSRRNSDRPVPFRLQLDFSQQPTISAKKSPTLPLNVISVRLNPAKTRDRRSNAAASAKLLITSLQAYLMAQQHHPEPA